MFRCCSLETSHPRLLPQSPKDCSIHLYLFFCSAYRVIITISSFFLELFLYSSPVAYLSPTSLASSPFTVISFCLSYCSWLSQSKNTEVVCRCLLQWTTFCQNSTMTRPSWLALHGMAHSCIEIDKTVIHVISLVSFLWLWFSFYLPSKDKDKRLVEASQWEGLALGESVSFSDGQGHAQYNFLLMGGTLFTPCCLA